MISLVLIKFLFFFIFIFNNLFLDDWNVSLLLIHFIINHSAQELRSRTHHLPQLLLYPLTTCPSMSFAEAVFVGFSKSSRPKENISLWSLLEVKERKKRECCSRGPCLSATSPNTETVSDCPKSLGVPLLTTHSPIDSAARDRIKTCCPKIGKDWLIDQREEDSMGRRVQP